MDRSKRPSPNRQVGARQEKYVPPPLIAFFSVFLITTTVWFAQPSLDSVTDLTVQYKDTFLPWVSLMNLSFLGYLAYDSSPVRDTRTFFRRNWSQNFWKFLGLLIFAVSLPLIAASFFPLEIWKNFQNVYSGSLVATTVLAFLGFVVPSARISRRNQKYILVVVALLLFMILEAVLLSRWFLDGDVPQIEVEKYSVGNIVNTGMRYSGDYSWIFMLLVWFLDDWFYGYFRKNRDVYFPFGSFAGHGGGRGKLEKHKLVNGVNGVNGVTGGVNGVKSGDGGGVKGGKGSGDKDGEDGGNGRDGRGPSSLGAPQFPLNNLSGADRKAHWDSIMRDALAGNYGEKWKKQVEEQSEREAAAAKLGGKSKGSVEKDRDGQHDVEKDVTANVNKAGKSSVSGDPKTIPYKFDIFGNLITQQEPDDIAKNIRRKDQTYTEKPPSLDFDPTASKSLLGRHITLENKRKDELRIRQLKKRKDKHTEEALAEDLKSPLRSQKIENKDSLDLEYLQAVNDYGKKYPGASLDFIYADSPPPVNGVNGIDTLGKKEDDNLAVPKNNTIPPDLLGQHSATLAKTFTPTKLVSQTPDKTGPSVVTPAAGSGGNKTDKKEKKKKPENKEPTNFPPGRDYVLWSEDEDEDEGENDNTSPLGSKKGKKAKKDKPAVFKEKPEDDDTFEYVDTDGSGDDVIEYEISEQEWEGSGTPPKKTKKARKKRRRRGRRDRTWKPHRSDPKSDEDDSEDGGFGPAKTPKGKKKQGQTPKGGNKNTPATGATPKADPKKGRHSAALAISIPVLKTTEVVGTIATKTAGFITKGLSLLEDTPSSLRSSPPPSEVALVEPEFNAWSHLQNGEVYGDFEKPAMKKAVAKPIFSLKQMIKFALWCICTLIVAYKVMETMRGDVSGSVREPFERYTDNHEGWSAFDLRRERIGEEVVF